MGTLRHKQKGMPGGRKTIRRGPGTKSIAGKDFHLTDEIDYIQRRAARHDGRLVTVGPLVLFSTETGDPEEVYFEENDTTFAIGWKGTYQIDGEAFVFVDHDTARVTTILGYPTSQLAQIA